MTKTTRIQLELPPKAFERLVRLKGNTEASSYSEVCRNALKLYQSLADHQASGKKLMARDADGNVTELILPGL